MEKICFTCKKIFISRNNAPGRGKYCSMKCRSHQRKHPAIPCPTCGKMFHPNNVHGIYCSRFCMLPPNVKSDPVERFWSYVNKTSSSKGCWLWTGHSDKFGYGKFSVFIDGKWKSVRSHKYAAELIIGKLPYDVHALHACDNPPCVRYHTEHVFTGTHQDNVADKVRKNRQAKGERVGNAKLTEEIVRDVRRRLLAGEKGREVAANLGITETNVSSIKLRQTWKHVL